MPRVLTLQRTAVPSAERQRFLERFASRRSHYEQAGCRYWVFEDAQLPGTFLEFIEAGEEQALVAAIAASPERHVDAGRIYREAALG
jgi:hypothetical protein